MQRKFIVANSTHVKLEIMEELILKFFAERPALNVKQVEKEAGLPASTLDKAIRGVRKIPEKHFDKLIPVLRKYGFQCEKQ